MFVFLLPLGHYIEPHTNTIRCGASEDSLCFYYLALYEGIILFIKGNDHSNGGSMGGKDEIYCDVCRVQSVFMIVQLSCK